MTINQQIIKLNYRHQSANSPLHDHPSKNDNNLATDLSLTF